jgi:hypothetical protein
MTNDEVIHVAKEITIAMFSADKDFTPTKVTGKVVADFLQVVYDKVAELNSSSKD